ncbi:OsmC family protein [Xanthomonas sp. 3498]|uniref:OsmC family protein n=1 Tax=Xanthomonas sp. 3498 TaxID=2663863 RepID=UPI00161FA7CE|nr:OsmC family protein [Xanthomonas sp. 3498]MBB5875751.1 organic hydroperoxide reductase OsmC/OhrA [Xanthomonas sp. 3498]
MTDTLHHYASQLHWTGNRGDGTADYSGYGRDYALNVPGKPTLTGSADPCFRGDPTLHNPEDLLVGALAACHMLTYLALCAHAGIRVLAYEDQAQGWLEMVPGQGGRFREVALAPRVTIAADGDARRAQALHAQAHAQCFVANSCAMPVRCEATIVCLDGSPEAGR